MNVSPYLSFNGNCAEAIALSEKAFGAKAEIVRYKDAPASAGYTIPPGTENNVMHANINLGAGMLMLCDVPPDMKANIGDTMSVMVTLDSIDQVKAAFDILKEGGTAGMELQETFWSKCFGSLNDKFGIAWMLSV